MTKSNLTTSKKLMALGFYCALLLAAPAFAHHSARAVFTDETIEIEGYVAEFNFTNPHASIYLDVTSQDGVQTRWLATGPAVPGLRQRGWSEDTVEYGQLLRISGKKGRNNRPMILISLPGSSVVELNPVDGSVIRDVADASVDNRRSVVAASLTLRLPGGRPNLTGTWFGGLAAYIVGRTTPPLNEVGLAVQATFDPINDPVFATCSNEPGLVRQAATILPKRITQYDDRVIIEYEGFAGRRVIFLDGRGPETEEHTRFGYHVARYDDDALVIETTQLLGHLTGPDGNALSDQTTTVERYRRTDSPEVGSSLEMTLIVSDPGHLTEPWTIITRFTPAEPGYEFAEVECQLPLLGPEEE